MTKKQTLDLYFLTARHLLIEVAAFMDRVDRSEGEEDFRMIAFRKAVEELSKGGSNRAERILNVFSDPTTEPVEKAASKSATGAYNPAFK
jgi:hypothetical protein